MDATMYRYLALRVKGDSHQWFVNIGGDTIFPSHIWQHRIYFQTPGEWEIIMVKI